MCELNLDGLWQGSSGLLQKTGMYIIVL